MCKKSKNFFGLYKMLWEIIGRLFGVYVIGKALCMAWSFLKSFVFPVVGWRLNLKSYGEWADLSVFVWFQHDNKETDGTNLTLRFVARVEKPIKVVTGATDGIGKGYAIELARKGYKIVLVSRSQERLDAVAEEIKSLHNTEIKTIAFDFGNTSGYDKIEKVLSEMNIGILVNNVGMGYEYPDYLENLSVEFCEKMVHVNMLSAVKMSHIVLKGMIARKKGILIHVASAAANFPIALLTLYSATKAFLDFFAQGLQGEYRDQGIISQSICPYVVSTKMARVKPGLFSPEPLAYAKQALGTVGVADRSHGYSTHFIQNLIFSFFPAFLRESAQVKIMKQLRAKALKKKDKKQ